MLHFSKRQKKNKNELCESGGEGTFQGLREIDDTARGRGDDPEPKKHQRPLDVRRGTDSMRSPVCIALHFFLPRDASASKCALKAPVKGPRVRALVTQRD